MSKVRILIQHKRGVFDPEGKVVHGGLERLGYDAVKHVRVGKTVELELEESPGPELDAVIDAMCTQFLVNPVIEDYTFEVLDSEDAS